MEKFFYKGRQISFPGDTVRPRLGQLVWDTEGNPWRVVGRRGNTIECDYAMCQENLNIVYSGKESLYVNLA